MNRNSRKIHRRGLRPHKKVIWRCCFAEDGKKKYQYVSVTHVESYCTAFKKYCFVKKIDQENTESQSSFHDLYSPLPLRSLPVPSLNFVVKKTPGVASTMQSSIFFIILLCYFFCEAKLYWGVYTNHECGSKKNSVKQKVLWRKKWLRTWCNSWSIS